MFVRWFHPKVYSVTASEVAVLRHRVEKIFLIEMTESGDEGVEVGFAASSVASSRGSQYEVGSFFTHGPASELGRESGVTALTTSSSYIGALRASASSVSSKRARLEEDPALRESTTDRPAPLRPRS